MSDKEIIITLINNKTENDRCDFKRKYYNNNKKFDLIKDVVSFANSYSIGDKYIVFNIDNDTYEISDMDITSLPDVSEIDILLNEYCEPNIMFEFNKFYYLGNQIAFLKISKNNLNFPYMIKKDYLFEGKAHIHKGNIYIRKGATNFIANRSDLDILIDMRESRSLKIEYQFIEQRQVVLDRQLVYFYSLPFIFANASKTNYLVKNANLNLAISNSVFNIETSFISNSNASSFTSQELQSGMSIDILANTTVQKTVYFKITPQCIDVLANKGERIKATLTFKDINNNEVVSNIQTCYVKNE